MSVRERCHVLFRRLASAGLGRYVQLFRVPGFGYLLGTSLLARLPEGMLGLAITLLVARNGSYARAGLVVAVYVAGSALAGPALGSLVDRLGRPPVLVPASLAEAAALCALALLPGASTITTLACALAAGLCTPPVVAAARSLWPEVLPAAQVSVVYGLEATLQELVYIVGPSLIALVVSLAGPAAAVVVTAAVLAAGAVAYSLHPSVRRRASPRPTGGVRRGWRPPLAISLLATALLLTGAFGLFELSTVAFARSRGAAAAAGVAIAVWSAGSLLGGVVFGARAGSARSPRRRLALLVLVLASLTLLPAAAPAVPILVPLLLVSGLAIAPTVAALYGLVASEVPAARGAEAFGWLSGAFRVGSALGAVAGGLVVQDAGAHAGYLAAGVVVALAAPALALAAWRRRERR